MEYAPAHVHLVATTRTDPALPLARLRARGQLAEEVERRLEDEKSLPDLVVIDGGKGQLSSAREALASLGLAEMPLISLAKRDEEVFILGDAAQTLRFTHVTTDRTSFMPGVVLAIRKVADLPESPTVGLEHLLD